MGRLWRKLLQETRKKDSEKDKVRPYYAVANDLSAKLSVMRPLLPKTVLRKVEDIHGVCFRELIQTIGVQEWMKYPRKRQFVL